MRIVFFIDDRVLNNEALPYGRASDTIASARFHPPRDTFLFPSRAANRECPFASIPARARLSKNDRRIPASVACSPSIDSLAQAVFLAVVAEHVGLFVQAPQREEKLDALIPRLAKLFMGHLTRDKLFVKPRLGPLRRKSRH